MSIIEKMEKIQQALKTLNEFIQRDEKINPDYSEYLKTMGTRPSVSTSLPYIFERRLGEGAQSVIERFLETSKKLSKDAKMLFTRLSKSFTSIYEIKKIYKNGFGLYNIINEKNYKVISLIKMTHLRGLGLGQYVVARLFEFEGEYYLIEVSNVLAANQKTDALRYAVSKIVQNPQLVYRDNPDKEKEIQDEIETHGKVFKTVFPNGEVTTTNKLADELLSALTDLGERGIQTDFSAKVQLPENYRYFEVKEFTNTYEQVLETSLGGFASHSETYDVGVIFDEELGLYAIPFYETFNKIFDAQTPDKIEGYKECVEHFLKNAGISANILKRVQANHPNFMEVINGILGTNYTFDELLTKYKNEYLTSKIYSTTTTLYNSKAFAQALEGLEEEKHPEKKFEKVGRNDPCPCGSGKKFKRCCGADCI